MFRTCFALLVLATFHLGMRPSRPPSAAGSRIRSPSGTASIGLGLSKPMSIAAGRQLQDMTLYEGMLYLTSDSAMVQAVDAETGATLWSKKIGRSDHPCIPLGVGGDMLAVVNGSRLYVANRYNGNILYEHEVDGATGGAARRQRSPHLRADDDGHDRRVSHRFP